MILFEDGLNGMWGLAQPGIKPDGTHFWYVSGTYETRQELENAIDFLIERDFLVRYRRVYMELFEEDE